MTYFCSCNRQTLESDVSWAQKFWKCSPLRSPAVMFHWHLRLRTSRNVLRSGYTHTHTHTHNQHALELCCAAQEPIHIDSFAPPRFKRKSKLTCQSLQQSDKHQLLSEPLCRFRLGVSLKRTRIEGATTYKE